MVSDHFWKLSGGKSARRCGAKHMSKSNCSKHTMFGPLLEVQMLKTCTPLWREAHFLVKTYKAFLEVKMSKKCPRLWREAHCQVKILKSPHARTTFEGPDVEKVHAVVARSTFPSQIVQSTPCSDHFLEVEMSKKCPALWREGHFQVKMLKASYARTTFGRPDVEKSVRRCGAKHISKSKVEKRLRVLSLVLTFRCRKSAH